MPGRCSAGGVHLRHTYEGGGELSHVPREPSCAFAVLFDPDAASIAGLFAMSVLSPYSRMKRTRCHMHRFRGSITRPQLLLSTLRAALADNYARLASAWWPAFRRRVLHPLGSCRMFQLSI